MLNRLRTLPVYNSEMGKWMETLRPNYMVTFSCPLNECYGRVAIGSTDYEGSLFKENIDTLIYRLPDRVFGRGSHKQNLYYATFYECFDKKGWPTYWHAHCLFRIPASFATRFEEQTLRQWARILGPSYASHCINFRHVTDVAATASYATKFAGSGIMFDMCLPEVATSL